MRAAPFVFDIFNASGYAQGRREAERREMHGRPDALALPDDTDSESRRSLAWLTSLARRRAAARAHRAAS